MNFIYKTATHQDIDILVTTRIEVLRAANKLADQVDMSEVAAQSRDYYEKALKTAAIPQYWSMTKTRSSARAVSVISGSCRPITTRPEGKLIL